MTRNHQKYHQKACAARTFLEPSVIPDEKNITYLKLAPKFKIGDKKDVSITLKPRLVFI